MKKWVGIAGVVLLLVATVSIILPREKYTVTEVRDVVKNLSEKEWILESYEEGLMIAPHQNWIGDVLDRFKGKNSNLTIHGDLYHFSKAEEELLVLCHYENDTSILIDIEASPNAVEIKDLIAGKLPRIRVIIR